MAEKLYDRTTRICEFNALRADHLAALSEYTEKRDLGDIGTQATLCGDTTSVKRRGNFIEKLLIRTPTITYISVVITGELLIWVVSSNSQPPTVISGRLNGIEVSDYDQKQMLDRGLEVAVAQTVGGGETGTYFIGLSEDEGGNRLRVGVLEAVKAAHHPASASE
jgi:hypothetical protein